MVDKFHPLEQKQYTMLRNASLRPRCPDAMIQELTNSADVEALEESYVKRFSHMPKVTFKVDLSKTISCLSFEIIFFFCSSCHVNEKYCRVT